MAMNNRHAYSNTVNSGQLYHVSALAIPLISHTPSNVPSLAPTAQLPALPVSTPSAPLFPHLDASDPISNNRITNLLKPSTFFAPITSSAFLTPPISSSVPTAALHPPLDLQRTRGTPLLQPFPPPTPPPSLTPNPTLAPNYGPVTREKVREALQLLVQDNQFIDLFCQALQKVHQS